MVLSWLQRLAINLGESREYLQKMKALGTRRGQIEGQKINKTGNDTNFCSAIVLIPERETDSGKMQ